MPHKRRTDAAVVVAAVLLLGVLALLRSAQNGAQESAPSTYDTGANGYAAVYDLLAREGARVERFERPIADLPRGAQTLVIAGTGSLAAAAPSASARALLDRWVHNGGSLLVLDSNPGAAALRSFSLPVPRRIARRNTASPGCAFPESLRRLRVSGAFAAAFTGGCARDRAIAFAAGTNVLGVSYPRGRGTITLVGTATILDNLDLSQRDNARIAYAMLGAHTVLFDERVHGFAQGRTFWEVLPRPMQLAGIIAVVAAILAIVGANLPFAPPYDPLPADERDSSAYIASLARMLERGGAVREAIAGIAAECERVLAPRAAGDEQARMLLREVRTLEGTPRPGGNDLLHAGRIFARVRKEYGC